MNGRSREARPPEAGTQSPLAAASGRRDRGGPAAARRCLAAARRSAPVRQQPKRRETLAQLRFSPCHSCHHAQATPERRPRHAPGAHGRQSRSRTLVPRGAPVYNARDGACPSEEATGYE